MSCFVSPIYSVLAITCRVFLLVEYLIIINAVVNGDKKLAMLERGMQDIRVVISSDIFICVDTSYVIV